MAYDEHLAERVRDVIGDDPRLSERKMFGGLCLMLDLRLPHAREMDFTGRTMKGMVFVGAKGIADERTLESWVDRGLDFAGSLPAKHRKQQ